MVQLQVARGTTVDNFSGCRIFFKSVQFQLLSLLLTTCLSVILLPLLSLRLCQEVCTCSLIKLHPLMWTCKTPLCLALEEMTNYRTSLIYITDLNPVLATSDWLSSLNNLYETRENLNYFNFIYEIFLHIFFYENSHMV